MKRFRRNNVVYGMDEDVGNQVSNLKIMAEKFSDKKIDVFTYFLDLEKAYDRVQIEKLFVIKDD